MFTCDQCQKQFSSYRQLNGHKVSHKSGPRYAVSRKTLPTYKCIQCGLEKPHGKRSTGKFCSNKCQHAYQWEHKILPALLVGKKLRRPALERYLTERDGYKCSRCEISSWFGDRISLDIDHIDGNNKNNAVSNLRFLCPNCHRQTPTWGNKKRV